MSVPSEDQEVPQRPPGALAAFVSRFRAHQNAPGQVIIPPGLTPLRFDDEEYDGLGEYDPLVTYRFIPVQDGYYIFSCSMEVFIAALTTVGIFIRRIAPPLIIALDEKVNVPAADLACSLQGTGICFLTAGQIVDVVLVCTANVTINTNLDSAHFEGHRLS